MNALALLAALVAGQVAEPGQLVVLDRAALFADLTSAGWDGTGDPPLASVIRPSGTSLGVTRETGATALCADGSTLCTWPAGKLRVLASGSIVEGAATEYLFNNCTAPATQTTPSLGVASYTGWVEGTGSVAFACSAAGGCTATGLPCTATAGVANDCHFTVTVAGTVDATVTGSVTFEQLTNESLPVGLRTSKICANGATAARNYDAVSMTVPRLSDWQGCIGIKYINPGIVPARVIGLGSGSSGITVATGGTAAGLWDGTSTVEVSVGAIGSTVRLRAWWYGTVMGVENLSTGVRATGACDGTMVGSSVCVGGNGCGGSGAINSTISYLYIGTDVNAPGCWRVP